MYPLARRFEETLDEGVAALDSAYAHFDRGDVREATASGRRARKLLRRAGLMARFLDGDRAPVEDELERARRLLEKVSGDTLAPNCPTSVVWRFDEQLATGDEALLDDDVTGAQLGYVAAYTALLSLLPPDERDGFPTPDWSETAVEPRASNDPGQQGRCGLCWEEQPRAVVRFADERVDACGRCTEAVDGRFETTTSIHHRCESILEDIRDISETSHGIEWLSPLEPDAEPATEGEPSTSSSDPTPEQVHIARALASVSEQVGHPATLEDVREHGSVQPDVVREQFGSWAAALEAAGLDRPEEESS
jgi:hypothetical protein